MSQRINLNTTPNQFMPILYFSQGDIGRTFEIALTSSDGYSIPIGATVEMVATKPSGFGFTVSGSLTNNVATFVTTETMTSEWGRFPAEIVIKNNGDVIGTANFYLNGERNPHPEGTIDGDASTIIPQLTLLVERVETAASSVLDRQTVTQTLPAGSQASYSFDEETNTQTFGIPQGEAGAGAVDVTASAYSSSKTYAVGDYVIHNDYLYRCTTAITTAEAWTSGHWTQVLLGDEVSDVKSASLKSGGVFDTTLYNSLGAVKANSMIFVPTSISPQLPDAPYTDRNFTLISCGFAAPPQAQYGGGVQLVVETAISTSLKYPILYRTFDGNYWSPWYGKTNFVKSSGLYIDGTEKASLYPNVDNFPLNDIILVANGLSAYIANSPFIDTAYYVLSTSYNGEAGVPHGGEIQFAIPWGNNVKGFKYRCHLGAWSEWFYIGDSETITYTATPSNFIEVIETAKQTPNATVHLTSGTYNLFDSTHDEAYWKSHRPATRYCGINLSNGIKLIGNGKVVFNGQYTGSDTDIMENFSIFNIAGSCQIKNITAIAENICYVVHDDQQIAINSNTEVEYENCRFKHNGTTYALQYGIPICIGGGIGPYVKRSMYNCVFSAPQHQWPVSYHTGDGLYGEIIMVGCYFENGTIVFSKMVGGEIFAIVRGCYLHSAVYNPDPDVVALKAWDNEIAS